MDIDLKYETVLLLSQLPELSQLQVCLCIHQQPSALGMIQSRNSKLQTFVPAINNSIEFILYGRVRLSHDEVYCITVSISTMEDTLHSNQYGNNHWSLTGLLQQVPFNRVGEICFHVL